MINGFQLVFSKAVIITQQTDDIVMIKLYLKLFPTARTIKVQIMSNLVRIIFSASAVIEIQDSEDLKGVDTISLNCALMHSAVLLEGLLRNIVGVTYDWNLLFLKVFIGIQVKFNGPY